MKSQDRRNDNVVTVVGGGNSAHVSSVKKRLLHNSQANACNDTHPTMDFLSKFNFMIL